jgi:hypothetical protein
VSTENEGSEALQQLQGENLRAVVPRADDYEAGVEGPVEEGFFFVGVVEDPLDDEGVELTAVSSGCLEDVY